MFRYILFLETTHFPLTFIPLHTNPPLTIENTSTTLTCEQVSHHPPVTAFHLSNANGVHMTGYNGQRSKFKATTIKVEPVGCCVIGVGVCGVGEGSACAAIVAHWYTTFVPKHNHLPFIASHTTLKSNTSPPPQNTPSPTLNSTSALSSLDHHLLNYQGLLQLLQQMVILLL